MNNYVGYEILVESFYDSNGDGIGDLKGVELKLPYLKELGVNLLWLTPFFCSPQYDNGYDVSDYYHVDPRYGSDDDLKNLISKMHEQGMKLIVDLVLNHTSIQHQWFKMSESKIEPYSNYYIWRDKPNNWLGFCGEAWTYSEIRQQYYFHVFSYQQADLNYENPLVLTEMKKIMKYYLDLGVDGFRLDAVSHLAKDYSFEDSSLSKEAILDTTKYSNRPELFKYMHELHDMCKEYKAILIGEVGGEASAKTLLDFTNKETGIMDYAFTFNNSWLNGLYGVNDASSITGVMFTAKKFISEYKTIYDLLHGRSMMVNYWLNHDHPRLASQYGDDKDDYSLSMLAGLLYLLPGMPFIYYGEEIGMRNALYNKRECFHDAYALERLAKDSSEKMFKHLARVNRDSARSPICWSNDFNHGFSSADTLARDFSIKKSRSWQDEMEDGHLWKFYQALISFKLAHPDLFEGELILLEEYEKDVVHYIVQGETSIEVYANLTSHEYPLNCSVCSLSNKTFIPNKIQGFEVLVREL